MKRKSKTVYFWPEDIDFLRRAAIWRASQLTVQIDRMLEIYREVECPRVNLGRPAKGKIRVNTTWKPSDLEWMKAKAEELEISIPTLLAWSVQVLRAHDRGQTFQIFDAKTQSARLKLAGDSYPPTSEELQPGRPTGA